LAISQRESIARASNDPTAGNEMKSEVGILSCTYSSQVIFETSTLTWARAETVEKTIEERTSAVIVGVQRTIMLLFEAVAECDRNLPDRANNR
jgi:hypothetical protein